MRNVDRKGRRGREGDQGDRTAARIRVAAIKLFHKRGFHAATMREIGKMAGIESATIYYYHGNKQLLLFAIMTQTIRDLHEAVVGSLTQDSPLERLRVFVQRHVEFHIVRREEAAISDSELDSLVSNLRKEITAARDEYESVLRDILKQGCGDRLFEIEDVRITAKALLTMATGVIVWYRPEGPLGPEALGRLHADLAARMVEPHIRH